MTDSPSEQVATAHAWKLLISTAMLFFFFIIIHHRRVSQDYSCPWVISILWGRSFRPMRAHRHARTHQLLGTRPNSHRQTARCTAWCAGFYCSWWLCYYYYFCGYYYNTTPAPSRPLEHWNGTTSYHTIDTTIILLYNKWIVILLLYRILYFEHKQHPQLFSGNTDKQCRHKLGPPWRSAEWHSSKASDEERSYSRRRPGCTCMSVVESPCGSAKAKRQKKTAMRPRNAVRSKEDTPPRNIRLSYFFVPHYKPLTSFEGESLQVVISPQHSVSSSDVAKNQATTHVPGLAC